MKEYYYDERIVLEREMWLTMAVTCLPRLKVEELLKTHWHSEIRAGKKVRGVWIPKDIFGIKKEYIFLDNGTD